jgi:hypothetical protein
MNLLEGRFMQGLREGFGAILVSLVMFGIFSGFLGGPRTFGQVWPILLIALGLWIIVQGMFRSRPRKDVEVIEEESKD